MQPASKWKKYTVLIGVLFLLPVGFSVFLVNGTHKFEPLPYFGPSGVEEGNGAHYTLPPFELTDQEGQPFTTDSLRGKIWVASFFSVSNPNLTKITKRLLYFDFRYTNEESIVQVHFTPDPVRDTPEVLRKYLVSSSANGDYAGKRYFLTGDSARVDSVLRQSFFLSDPSNDATLWLVDPDGHLRGKFNANTEMEMGDCIDAVANLKKELDTRKYHER